MRRLMLIGLLTLTTPTLGTASPQDGPPMSTPPPLLRQPRTSPKIEKIKTGLAATLAKQMPNSKIETRCELGPPGFTVVVAAVPGAYPGSGVARVLVDDHDVSAHQMLRMHNWNSLR